MHDISRFLFFFHSSKALVETAYDLYTVAQWMQIENYEATKNS